MPDRKCTNCFSFGESCTYLQPSHPRPKNRTVEELKQKVAALEAKLRMLSVCSLCSRPLQSTFDDDLAHTDTPEVVIDESRDESDETSDEESEDEDVKALTRQFKHSFFGSDSTFSFVRKAITIKEKYLGPQAPTYTLPKAAFQWDLFPWEKAFYHSQPVYTFPPPDLMQHLLQLYFINVHPIFPILHRPTTSHHIREKLYLHDPSFGAVLLAVFSGRLFSDDPRVLTDGETLSAGWKFASQIRMVPNLSEPTLHDVQFYALMTLYFMGGTASCVSWMYLGLGVRLIQYHRQYPRNSATPQLEDELWNRAFWCIFILDGKLSTFLGRTPSLHAEDFDVAPPLEVDDEYWESPHGFLQPATKPSALCYFTHLVRLCEILAKTLRRLCTTNPRSSRTPEHEMDTVAELDSLMNGFLDSLPEHLRWPDAQGIFFDQSAVLQITYHAIQNTIHRPFIHRRDSAAARPSLIICLTAARSTVIAAETWATRTRRTPSTWSFSNPVFISCIVLLLNVFATKRAAGDSVGAGAGASRSRVDRDVEKDLTQVESAMAFLRTSVPRWRAAGPMIEFLHALKSLDQHLSVPRMGTVPTIDNPSSSLPYQFNYPVSASNQPEFKPGTSIEELLSGGGGACGDFVDLDNELMSMWLQQETPNIGQWEAYVNAMPVVHMGSSWSKT
ncbi:fungal-specific transcription factor domain-containing protein [Roridomyces roridus]|uniref:Fungal-specific transcription factor domain-containing protein n=1 Tax=Roridomyces roridus TaxID=1738132 RepID=A0AAD7FDE1_9AGAR|nr:fungal-specific transcription factor domain-containing protein [Roridomyces roridus]